MVVFIIVLVNEVYWLMEVTASGGIYNCIG